MFVLLVVFDEFGEDAAERAGMQERHQVSAEADPGGAVDQLNAFGGERIQRSGEIGHRVGNMMKPRATPFQKPGDAAGCIRRLDQLHPAIANCERGGLDVLVVQYFPDNWLRADRTTVLRNGRVEVGNNDANVMNALQVHGA